jgi:hypothetical protein
MNDLIDQTTTEAEVQTALKFAAELVRNHIPLDCWADEVQFFLEVLGINASPDDYHTFLTTVSERIHTYSASKQAISHPPEAEDQIQIEAQNADVARLDRLLRVILSASREVRWSGQLRLWTEQIHPEQISSTFVGTEARIGIEATPTDITRLANLIRVFLPVIEESQDYPGRHSNQVRRFLKIKLQNFNLAIR